MDFGSFMGLLVATGGFVGFVAILGEAYKTRLQHKERMAEIKAGEVRVPVRGRDETVEKLEHRLRVLERIATDKGNSLAREIEDLRAIEDAR